MEIDNLAVPDDGVDGGLRVVRRRRVAVIAVHGVADQKLGETCQALAELLIAQTPNGFVYEPGVRQDEILQVKLLEARSNRIRRRTGCASSFGSPRGPIFCARVETLREENVRSPRRARRSPKARITPTTCWPKRSSRRRRSTPTTRRAFR